MSKIVESIDTELGTVNVEVIACDVCSKTVLTSKAGNWLRLRVPYGGWSHLACDVCSTACLSKYVSILPSKVNYASAGKFNHKLDDLRKKEAVGDVYLTRRFPYTKLVKKNGNH